MVAADRHALVGMGAPMSEKPLLAKWRLLRQAAEDERLTAPADFRVLVAVLDRMNNELVSWPGFGRIAGDVHIARSTVIESIKRLVDLGYLVKGRDRKHNSNQYRLGSPKVRTSPRVRTSSEPRTGGSPKVRTGVVRTSGPAVVRTSGPEFDSLNPPNEPDSLNPSNTDAHARRFDDFWTAYPRKEGKQRALKSWKRQKLDAMADEILEDVRARLADPGQWKGREKKHLPFGSTYVNERRWEDEWSPSADPAKLPRESDEDLKAAQAEAERITASWKN